MWIPLMMKKLHFLVQHTMNIALCLYSTTDLFDTRHICLCLCPVFVILCVSELCVYVCFHCVCMWKRKCSSLCIHVLLMYTLLLNFNVKGSIYILLGLNSCIKHQGFYCIQCSSLIDCSLLVIVNFVFHSAFVFNKLSWLFKENFCHSTSVLMKRYFD